MSQRNMKFISMKKLAKPLSMVMAFVMVCTMMLSTGAMTAYATGSDPNAGASAPATGTPTTGDPNAAGSGGTTGGAGGTTGTTGAGTTGAGTTGGTTSTSGGTGSVNDLWGQVGLDGVGQDLANQDTNLDTLVSKGQELARAITSIMAIISFLALLFWVAKLATSAGNPQNRKIALTGILFSGIALAIFGGAWVVVSFFWNLLSGV